MNIEAIPVKVAFDKFDNKERSTEEFVADSINIKSVLVEIQHGLDNLYKNGQNTIIDLGAIPLASFERLKLFEILGQGEVHIRLSSLGESEIYETLFSGVWVIKHHDEKGDVSAMFIEVNKIPDIILSQKEDVSGAIIGLQKLIAALE